MTDWGLSISNYLLDVWCHGYYSRRLAGFNAYNDRMPNIHWLVLFTCGEESLYRLHPNVQYGTCKQFNGRRTVWGNSWPQPYIPFSSTLSTTPRSTSPGTIRLGDKWEYSFEGSQVTVGKVAFVFLRNFLNFFVASNRFRTLHKGVENVWKARWCLTFLWVMR